MPNIKSAKKRVNTSETKALRNKMIKTALKSSVKKYEAAIESGDKEAAAEIYKATVKKIDKAVAKGIMPKNTAARRKSLFTRKLNTLA